MSTSPSFSTSSSPANHSLTSWLRANISTEHAQAILAGAWFASLLSILSLGLLLPIYVYYFLAELPAIRATLIAHLLAVGRDKTLEIFTRLHLALSAFLRGRLVVAILKGLFLSLGLFICGLRFSFILGLASGILSIVPFLGAVLGFAVAAGLSIADETTLASLLKVAAVFLTAEAFEGFVLIPLLMGRQLGLHPLTIIISIFLWTAIFGFFGALLAIPLTLILKILATELLLPPIKELSTDSRVPRS